MKHNNKNLCSLVQAYFDGQINQDDLIRFKAHLKHCPNCQNILRKLNSVSDFVKSTQESVPDKAFFDTIWERVEDKLVQERLSVFGMMQGWIDNIFYYVRFFLKPALAVCFIFLLIMLPHLEKRVKDGVHVALRVESEIKRIESKTNVMIVKTKPKRWTVIWVMPPQRGGGKSKCMEI